MTDAKPGADTVPPIFVYMTAGSMEEAETIATALVTDRLAACVNILPGMRSVYRWQGAVERGDELVLIAKTRADRFSDLSNRVRSLHSYAVPCIVELPLGRGTPDYLHWIITESALPAA